MLEEVKCFKDLEIISNHHLPWNSRVDNIVSNKRTCRGLADVNSLQTLKCSTRGGGGEELSYNKDGGSHRTFQGLNKQFSYLFGCSALKDSQQKLLRYLLRY